MPGNPIATRHRRRARPSTTRTPHEAGHETRQGHEDVWSCPCSIFTALVCFLALVYVLVCLLVGVHLVFLDVRGPFRCEDSPLSDPCHITYRQERGRNLVQSDGGDREKRRRTCHMKL